MEGDKEQQDKEGSSNSGGASTEPPEPVLSAVTAKREDQIQNAVAFLSHPKVRTSSVDSKRSFLQKKGLTEAEIEEAFKRVPEASDTTVGAPDSTTNQLAEASRPQKPFPTATASGPYQPYQSQTALQQPQQALLQPAGYRWSQVALGAGIVAVTAWGIRSFVVPQAVHWYRSFTGQPGSAVAKQTEQSEAAKILADAITAQTAELRAAVDSLKDMTKAFEQIQKDAASRKDTGVSLADLRQELRSFASTSQLTSSSGAAQPAGPDNLQQTLDNISRTLAQLTAGTSPSPSSSMPNGIATASPNTGRSGEGSTVSRQLPFALAHDANPGQGIGNSPSAAPSSRGSPGSQYNGSPEPSPQPRSSPFAADRNSPFMTDLGSPEGALSIQTSPGEPPHPASYQEVLDMLEKGQTPPGIRTDINDKPPNPQQAIPGGKMVPRPKPWERAAQNGTLALGAENSSSAFNAAGSNGTNRKDLSGSRMPFSEQTSSTQAHNGVEITEVAATPSAGNSPTGSSSPAPWKPPAIPQASMNLGKRTKSETSSSA